MVIENLTGVLWKSSKYSELLSQTQEVAILNRVVRDILAGRWHLVK